MHIPDFKEISISHKGPKWFGISRRYWEILLMELIVSIILSVLSSGRPEFPFIRLNLDTPYGPILLTIVGILIFAKPAAALLGKLECWKDKTSCTQEYWENSELSLFPESQLKTPSYHNKLVVGSAVIMMAVILLDILKLSIEGWIGFMGYLSPYVKSHAPWAFYLRVALSLVYYGLLIWIYSYWASFMAYFISYVSLLRSLKASEISPIKELQELYNSHRDSCLSNPTYCIQTLTNIAEGFVELRKRIKELFGPGFSVASGLLAVSVLSAAYVVVTKYTSIPQNDAGVLSGWGFLLGSLALFGTIMRMASNFVSAVKEETTTYVHKIRIGLINAGGNDKAYELLDEIEQTSDTMNTVPLRSDELIELISIVISVILALLTGSG